MATPEQIAWAAGLFEGEGCIAFCDERGVRLSLAMIDRDAVEGFAAIVAVGTITQKYRNHPERKPMFMWRAGSREDVLDVLELLTPWLYGRRSARAQAAVERLQDNRGRWETQTHCIRNHELSGANLYVTSRGHRQCRECGRLRKEHLRSAV